MSETITVWDPQGQDVSRAADILAYIDEEQNVSKATPKIEKFLSLLSSGLDSVESFNPENAVEERGSRGRGLSRQAATMLS